MTVTTRSLAALIISLSCLGQSVRAATVESQIAVLATDVHKALDALDYSTCTINIKGPTMYPGSGPALITELLATHLGKLGIAPKKFRADVGLSGEMKIREVKDKGTGKVSSLVVVITLNFVDRNDNPILNLDSKKINIVDRGEVARILGIPHELDHAPPSHKPGHPPATKPSRPSGIYDGFDNPKQTLTGTVIRAKGDGLFGIEIIKGSHPCKAGIEEGLAFIDLAKTDKCHVLSLIHI